jgi:hypothetical protein
LDEAGPSSFHASLHRGAHLSHLQFDRLYFVPRTNRKAVVGVEVVGGTSKMRSLGPRDWALGCQGLLSEQLPAKAPPSTLPSSMIYSSRVTLSPIKRVKVRPGPAGPDRCVNIRNNWPIWRGNGSIVLSRGLFCLRLREACELKAVGSTERKR